jgi:hypothetical protein
MVVYNAIKCGISIKVNVLGRKRKRIQTVRNQQDGGRKMKQMIIAVLACFAVLAATPDYADSVVVTYNTYGKDLLHYCDDFITRTATVNESAGICQGFVEGAIDTYNIGAVGQSIKNPPLLCIPETVNLDQAIRVVRKYLEDHPEKLHLPAAKLVIEAIKTAWPCQKK